MRSDSPVSPVKRVHSKLSAMPMRHERVQHCRMLQSSQVVDYAVLSRIGNMQSCVKSVGAATHARIHQMGAPSRPAILSGRTHSDMHARPQVVKCARQDSHAWKECPFTHAKENARRRDVQLFSYTTRECPCYKASGLCAEGAYAVTCLTLRSLHLLLLLMLT